MNNVLLGNVAVVTNSVDVPMGPPNPDGTYNITLPPNESGGNVVAKETDVVVDETGLNPEGNYDDNGNDQIKKILPFIIAGAVILFLYSKRKK